LGHYQEIVVRPSFLLRFSLISCAGGAALAQAQVADSPEPIVVTATRIPTPEEQVASSITVVSAEDIAARQVRTLPDLLQQVPGLNVVQTGGPGGQTSVFMRGTNSNHTKVLVDGIDLSDPSNPTGAFDFGQFLTQDIERVEILRGPQSGLYGSDAIGGVINIITKTGQGPAQFNARVEAGSFDTFNQAAGVSGSTNAFHYAANLDHEHAAAMPVTPLDLLSPGERRIDDYDDNLSVSTKLGYDLAAGLDVGLVARYTETHLRLTADSNFFSPDATQSENDTRQLFTRATAHWVAFGGAFEETFGLAYSNLKSADLSPDDSRSDLSGERVKADWLGNIRLASGERLVLGVEHQRDEIQLPIVASTNIDSGFAELQSEISEALFNTVSARYDDNNRFGGKATYRLAPAYLLDASGTKFKATVGTGFKAPTLDQLFQSFPAFGFFANPSLRPESSVGWDVGVEQALAADRVKFGVTYFHNSIKNLIGVTADFSTYTNIGRAVTEGAESFVSYQPSAQIAVRLDYTYTAATDEIAHQELLRRPKHKADLSLGWTATSRLNINASVLGTSTWIDGNRDFSISRLTAPGFVTANLAANYDVTGHLSVFARINNVFDHHYENPIGFLQPSRGAYAGVKTRF
jgi:vitamin B12 transporter